MCVVELVRRGIKSHLTVLAATLCTVRLRLCRAEVGGVQITAEASSSRQQHGVSLSAALPLSDAF